MAGKGKTTEEIIGFLREAEVRACVGTRALAAHGIGASGVRRCWPITHNAASAAEGAC
jgi:hypothetical protein